MSIVNNPVVRYFLEAKAELEKVSWPTQKDIILYSSMVVGLSLGLAVLFGLLDWGLTAGLEALIKTAAI